MGKVIKVVSDCIFFAGLIAAGAFLFLHFTGRKPLQVFIVSSGSMEPAIKTGGIVLVAPKPSYQLGDVITFYSGSGKKNTSTHRIVAIDDSVIRTAGDANEDIDPSPVMLDKVVGNVRLTVPYLGFLASFAKTPRGFILLVIVPATIVIYEELKGLISELRKKLHLLRTQGYANRRAVRSPTRSGEGDEHLQSLTPSAYSLKPAIILPIFFSALVLGSLTVSFFVDRETSAGNAFSRGGSAPTPTISITPTPTLSIAQTLVMNEILPDTTCSSGNTPGQFVELWNGTGGPVDLQNFKLSDGTNTIAISNSNTSLPSVSFAILVKSNGVINQCLNSNINGAISVNLGGTVDLNTGQLQLLDAQDNVIDTILWGSGPNPTPPQNQSIERSPTGLDSALGVNFTPTDFVIRNPVTPGL